MVEGRMDDAVGALRGGAQTVEIVHVSAGDLRPGPGQGLGPGVRTAEPDHLMAGGDELRNEMGADKARGAGQEHSHVGHSG